LDAVSYTPQDNGLTPGGTPPREEARTFTAGFTPPWIIYGAMPETYQMKIVGEELDAIFEAGDFIGDYGLLKGRYNWGDANGVHVKREDMMVLLLALQLYEQFGWNAQYSAPSDQEEEDRGAVLREAASSLRSAILETLGIDEV